MQLDHIEYRKLKGIKEFQACEDLQLKVWGFSERELFPARHLLTAQQNGGLVLGAFNNLNDLVGYSYAFLGSSQGKYYLYSHMLGLLEEYKYKNIGYNLKLLQRKIALERNLNLIKWTFDPLEGVNANLNLHKLGVIITEYYVDYYGEFSGINYGLPTDRFLVEWNLNSTIVLDKLNKKIEASSPLTEYCLITKISQRENGFLELIDINMNCIQKKILVEIPPSIQEIKSIDFELAMDWRIKLRNIFTDYLSKGYIVIDFCSSTSGEERKSFYFLVQVFSL